MKSVSCTVPASIETCSIKFASKINPGILDSNSVQPVEIITPSIAAHNIPDNELAKGVCITQTNVSDHLVRVCLSSFIA